MPILYKPDQPDLQTIRMTFADHNLTIDRWTSYEFASDFLTPSDGFRFSLGIGDSPLPQKQQIALRLGARIRLYVDDYVLADGYIDSIDVTADRSSGTVYSISGRDRLGQTLDAVMDPTFQFKEGGSLAELLDRCFSPFGWSGSSAFVIDQAANRDAKSGVRGPPVKRSASTAKVKPLRSFLLHQTKPYNHESVYHFASRVAQRHGLWIWPTADGEKLIIGKPDYNQAPRFRLVRDRKGNGNILNGSLKFDLTDQPAILMADAFIPGGSGEFGKSRTKAYVINPILGLTEEGEPTSSVKEVIEKYPGAVENTIPMAAFPFRIGNVPFRPLFLHDDESKTQEQLNNYVKREMSLLLRKSLTASYTVEGHGQTVEDRFVAWTPDTLVEIYDEAANYTETMYILGVHFMKSRGGSGTTTRLDLIRINSIVF